MIHPLICLKKAKASTVLQRSITIRPICDRDAETPAGPELLACDWRPPVQWECEIRVDQREMNSTRRFIRLVEPDICLAVN